MKRNQLLARPPSPTNTTYSGISNYRTESYKPIPIKGRVPSLPSMDSRGVAKIHYEEMAAYLMNHLAKEPANARSSAREKLTRLTRQQFQELSTDVYDELIRRKNNSENEEVPFLPVRDDFHPKRNQARQKLATLPKTRFKDLSSDVFHELGRRYPEFKEPDSAGLSLSPSSAYDDMDVPSPDFPQSPPASSKAMPPSIASVSSPLMRSATTTTTTSDSGYAGSSSGGGRRPSEDGYSRRRPSEDNYSQMEGSYGSSRRKLSQDTANNTFRGRSPDLTLMAPPRRSEEADRELGRDLGRKTSATASTTSDSTVSAANAQREMIVPNKSTIAEEDIEVPYGAERQRERERERERESNNTAIDERRSGLRTASPEDSGLDLDLERSRGGGGDTDFEGPSASEPDSARSPQMNNSGILGGFGGLSGLRDRLRGRVQEEDEDEDERVPSAAGTRSGEEYYDKMSFGRASVASERSTGGAGVGRNGSTSSSAGAGASGVGRSSSRSGNADRGEDPEGLRREYEFKIATMQSRMAGLERELEDASERERRLRAEAEASSAASAQQQQQLQQAQLQQQQQRGRDDDDREERVRSLERELDAFREEAERQSAMMLSLQRELEEVKEEKAREVRQGSREREEIEMLRRQVEILEAERGGNGNGNDPDLVEQLRGDLEGLMAELSDLSARNEELMAAKDTDHTLIQNMDQTIKEYKRKYEQAKTELRSVKATSQLFLHQAPKLDSDQLPMSADGGLLDIHVTAFLSAIDNLLNAGRGNSPTRVLTPMKSVLNTVTALIEDTRAYERRQRRSMTDVDPESLRSLRERVEATLGNLVTASKTHATSFGMSPVSLLDAAASHLAAAVTEIGRVISVRKATRQEQEAYAAESSPPPSSSLTNGFVPSLRSVEEVKGAQHQRTTSAGSSRRDDFSSPSGGAGRWADLNASMSSNTMSPRFGGANLGTTSGRSSTEDTNWRRPSSASSSNASSPPPIFDQTRVNGGGGGGGASDDSAVAEGPDEAWTELKPYLDAQSESIVYAIQSVLSGVRSPTPAPTLNENLTQIITIVSSIVAVCKDSLPPGSAQQGRDILHELSDHANRLSEVQSEVEVTKESRQVMAKSSFAVANAMKQLMKL